ncbi:hypothetical protein KR093_009665, partial [Drosophila rubida]
MSTVQDELRLYITATNERLQQLLKRLQWTEEGKHRTTEKSKDTEKTDQQQLPPICLPTSEYSVQLKQEEIQQLLGEHRQLEINSFDDLQFNYNASQRLMLYEHVVKKTPRQLQSCEENANLAELVAETKRVQQQQRRHRKSKQTLREQMHQLVELQMQAMMKLQQQKDQKLQQRQQREGATSSKPRQGDRRQRYRSRSRSRCREERKRRSRSRQRHRKRSRSRQRSRSLSPSHSR